MGDVVEMLEGQLMPRRTNILTSLVAVTFIGKGSLPKSRLKTLFCVHRKVVHAALLELKHGTRHPGYTNLEIDEEALDSLPEDGIPDEILATVRQETDDGVATQESAGYVPMEEADDIQDEEGPALSEQASESSMARSNSGSILGLATDSDDPS
ncbi:hypothetical protein FRC10_003239, partial [Ceratobasidium sp. 414]